MQFFSTRDQNRKVTSSEAIAQGLSNALACSAQMGSYPHILNNHRSDEFPLIIIFNCLYDI